MFSSVYSFLLFMQYLPLSLQQHAPLNSSSYPFCNRLVVKMPSSLSSLSSSFMVAAAAKATTHLPVLVLFDLFLLFDLLYLLAFPKAIVMMITITTMAFQALQSSHHYNISNNNNQDHNINKDDNNNYIYQHMTANTNHQVTTFDDM